MNIIEILKVIVMGLVEGFTEWLPISSTGHLILVEELIHLNVSADPAVNDAFWNMFKYVIQFGAILAVVIMYFKKLNPFSRRKRPEQKRATWDLWKKIIIACLPAGILGVFLNDWLDRYLQNGLVVSVMLILYGVIFIVVENINRFKSPVITRTRKISYQVALYIGAFQVLSLIPGTSRSGATILGAMLLGCSRSVSAEFSFYLGIPVLCGASLYKFIKFMSAMKELGAKMNGSMIFYMFLGIIIAFFVSVYSIRFLMSWVKKHDFKFFGYYRIALGAVVLIWYMISTMVGV